MRVRDAGRSKRRTFASARKAENEYGRSLRKIATQRTQEAKGRAASTPNVVRQNIDTDYLRASAEATSARQPEQVLAAQLQSIDKQLSALDKYIQEASQPASANSQIPANGSLARQKQAASWSLTSPVACMNA